MSYTYQQALDASVSYFNGDELAAQVFVGKYALRDMVGNLLELTPPDMHRRLAKEFARIEKRYPNPMSEEEIYELLSSWDVVPQGSPMSAIGNENQYQSLSNCFVIDSPHDSYGGIMKTDQEQAQIMKRRGGVGFDISTIRPKGLLTANAARTTDGIGVFMERFSNTCREVAQGGRRGALMLSLSVHHSELRTFINIKKDKKKVTGANVSIRLTDEFMRAVENGEKVQLRFPIEANVPHLMEEYVDARELWNDIIQSAWESAEPGLLFWDTIIRRSPGDSYKSLGFNSVSCNPCAEQVLAAYDACRLLLVNFANFVSNPFTENASFDYERFSKVTQKAQRLMDDLVDLETEAIYRIIMKINRDPEPDHVKRDEQELWERVLTKAVHGRRTGLGITGLGDALAYMNIRYGSDASVEATHEMYKSLALNSWRSSVTMAQERGAFPIFSHELEKDNEFINDVLNADPELRDAHTKFGRRNIAITTTPPAGSVSILTQTTSGCEPAFLLSYKRRKKINPNDIGARVDFTDALGDKWQEYIVYHPGFKKWMDVTGKSDPTESPYHGATSNDVDWVKKIELQAAAQKWVCSAISNTTNIPKDTPVDVVKQIYMKGWKSGCKGVTIYRDGSRDGVLVAEDKKEEKKVVVESQPNTIMHHHAPKRPKELECDIHKVNIKGESYLIFVGMLNGAPYEIFAGLSEHVEVPKKAKKGILIKNGRKEGLATYNLRIPVGDDDSVLFKDIVNLFNNPVYGAFTRTLSLAMRHGVPIQYLAEQLRKDKHSDITSFSAVIARTLIKNYVPDGTKATVHEVCPQCGSENLAYQGGCVTCMQCGYAGKCG